MATIRIIDSFRGHEKGKENSLKEVPLKSNPPIITSGPPKE